MPGKGMTVMLITCASHGRAHRRDRLIVMSEGRIVADGNAEGRLSSWWSCCEARAPPSLRRRGELIYELRRDGFELPLDALTVDECADAVMAATLTTEKRDTRSRGRGHQAGAEGGLTHYIAAASPFEKGGHTAVRHRDLPGPARIAIHRGQHGPGVTP
ncbi:MAG: hypothetical protein ACLTSG_08190 [Lachnospiraceae bacterium]